MMMEIEHMSNADRLRELAEMASRNEPFGEYEAMDPRRIAAGLPDELTFDAFSRANIERCESAIGFHHPIHSWSLSDWFLGTMGELGEAANIGKKLNRVRDGIRGNKEVPDELWAKLRTEIGDTYIYLDLLTQSLGWAMSAIVAEAWDAKSAGIADLGRIVEPEGSS